MGNSMLNCKTICNAIRSYDESTEFTNEYDAYNDYNENINISKMQCNSIDLENSSSYEISKIIFDKVNDFRFRPDEYLGEAESKGVEDAFKKSIEEIDRTGIRPELFIWSDKKYNLLANKEMDKLCKEKYAHDDYVISFDVSNVNKITSDEIVWNIIQSIDKCKQFDFLMKEYCSCAISALVNNSSLKVVCVFLFRRE